MKIFYWASAAVFAAVLILLVFVPAFSGRLVIPPQISLGKFAIRLYGLTMAGAILVGYIVARKYSWKFGISHNEVDDIAFWITIAGLLGARLYYVAFEWHMFSPDLSEVYKIWHGGLSIYGALIAGLVFIVFYTRKKAYSVYQLLDLVAISLPLSQAIGRLGNFFNQEAFGIPTNLPWKMHVELINRPPQFRQYEFFHPTFAYEALCSIVIFFVLTRLLLGKVKPGVLAFAYLGLYSTVRFFIEGLRLDSSYIGSIRIDQVTAIVCVIAAGAMIIYRHRGSKLVS
jgi:phosphatidylglycerol:prolipoprotein diacylglycerol transferase